MFGQTWQFRPLKYVPDIMSHPSLAKCLRCALESLSSPPISSTTRPSRKFGKQKMMKILEISREDMCLSCTDSMMILQELFDNFLIRMEQMDSVSNLRTYRNMQYLVFKEMSANFARWCCPSLRWIRNILRREFKRKQKKEDE